jgi:hypothetical protein
MNDDDSMVEIGDGRSTTADLLVDLRYYLPQASAQDRRPILALIRHLEGDAGNGAIGRPRIDDSAAIASIKRSVALGMALGTAVYLAARKLKRVGEAASMHSTRQRLYRKLRESGA